MGSRIPKSRPQAAPISREGMKTPADTVRPYVQHASKKYVRVNNPRVCGLYVPIKRIKTQISDRGTELLHHPNISKPGQTSHALMKKK